MNSLFSTSASACCNLVAHILSCTPIYSPVNLLGYSASDRYAHIFIRCL